VVLSTTNELDNLLNSQIFMTDFDGAADGHTTTWANLEIIQQLKVLDVLASYFQLVQDSTTPEGTHFMPNVRASLKAVRFRPWFVAEDMMQLASYRSNAVVWSTIGKSSNALMNRLNAYHLMSTTEQDAEYALHGSTLEQTALAVLRTVHSCCSCCFDLIVLFVLGIVSGCLRQQHQITPDLVLFWGFVCANSQISIALV
jgi:hypothetical protein